MGKTSSDVFTGASRTGPPFEFWIWTGLHVAFSRAANLPQTDLLRRPNDRIRNPKC